jgi:hypothetical protein
MPHALPVVFIVGLLAASQLGPAAVAGLAAPPTTWLAGAAAVSITPPLYNPAHDARDFPTCNTTVFNGHRVFDFEEPYIDQAGTGEFKYPDPFCDANANGRYDGDYSSGGVDHLLEWVHDDVWSRALAISDGTSTIVILSVTSQGLMNEDIALIRQKVKADRPGVTDVFVSSTHNESSPDPIGIYGAPSDPSVPAGARSGIDDYYISYLVNQSALSAEQAYDTMRPAGMRAADVQVDNVKVRLSITFPTTYEDQSPATTDTKLRVLQLYDSTTHGNIETVLNWAAHNQQTGHAPDSATSGGLRINRSVSDDWPGQFSSGLESAIGGQAMFMVADNGSIEDPHMVPDTVCPGEGCLSLPVATGAALAQRVAAALTAMGPANEIAPHTIGVQRDVFDVPLQNNVFIAAFAAGLFAHRHLASDGALFGISGPAVKTEVGLVDFGPGLQILANPGEAFPGLALGSPFGIEEASCPNRPNPPVPAWHADASHRLQMGLGNDMIGYETAAWAWYEIPAVYSDPNCLSSDPSSNTDPRGHKHKLESESLGPDGPNIIATHLAALADLHPDATAHIQSGRFILSDGTFTRRGAGSPVGMWVLPSGVTTFTSGTGTLVAIAGIDNFGGHAVNANGVFMDSDGQAQAGPSLDTRGMMVTAPDGSVTRYYMDPYPALTGNAPGAPIPPATVPDFQPALAGLMAMVVGVAFLLVRRRRSNLMVSR